jgi:hypothetical protein
MVMILCSELIYNFIKILYIFIFFLFTCISYKLLYQVLNNIDKHSISETTAMDIDNRLF